MAADLDAAMDEVTAAAVAMRAATEALAKALSRLADAAELADGNLSDDDRAALRHAPVMIADMVQAAMAMRAATAAIAKALSRLADARLGRGSDRTPLRPDMGGASAPDRTDETGRHCAVLRIRRDA